MKTAARAERVRKLSLALAILLDASERSGGTAAGTDGNLALVNLAQGERETLATLLAGEVEFDQVHWAAPAPGTGDDFAGWIHILEEKLYGILAPAAMEKSKGVNVQVPPIRTTISLPAELAPFVNARASDLQHAGNVSSYIRSLILRDRREAELTKKAEVPT